MKTTRWFLLSFVAFLGSVNFASAQWSVGVRGGTYIGSVSQPQLITNLAPEFRWSARTSASIFAEYQFSDHVAIRPEVSFQQKGFMMRGGTSFNLGNFPIPLGGRSTFRTDYVDVPVLLKLSTGGDVAHAYFIVGPAVGYAAGATLVTRPQVLIELRPIRTNIGLESVNYQRFEFSGIAGVGVGFQAGPGQIMAEARYQQGISRLLDLPIVRANVRNQGVAISLGYQIPL
ncbi:hypothetical protein GCM10027275_05550 [Rhabdobacter roseus]|uniref:Outer membrane protein beta-barrel domain-containing protein n=1 Tax=Rhabdobacter roseus TaxID=1655419 RepID=A0A840THL1_9BACT|nr:porin family protein [Rhabdobacter roseus]MBB5282445.1 hypothetical protein [Rhabdobacter roseus]